jgi:hypothetical protein
MMIPATSDQSNEAHAARIKARFLREINHSIGRFNQTGRIVILILMACTFVLMPIALLLARRLLARTEDEEIVLAILRRARKFGRRAVAIVAYPLMVNSALRIPGAQRAPGLVVTAFDTVAQRDLGFMTRLAESLSRGGGTEGEARKWSKEQRRFAEELMVDEEYRPFRRRQIPVGMTGGHTVYACDLLIEPDMLADGFLSDDCPLLPCLAEPGETGLIFLLPYWMAAAPDEPATAAQVDEFEAALVYFDAIRRATPTWKK